MRISVTRPLEQALNHTKAILFDDFRFKMWLGLGFCAFLANLQITFPNVGDNLIDPERIGSWAESHPELAVVIGLVIGGLGLGVWIVFLWLQSRGKFMFLDGVLTNRGAIREPWRRFKYLGNNLFLFQLVLLFGLVILLGINLVAIFIGVAVENDATGLQRSIGLGLIGIGVALMALVFVFYLVLLFILESFLVPTMYRHNTRALDALGTLNQNVFKPHVWSVVLYFLMTILLALASLILAFIGICITCFVAALPYVTYVVFLPMFVFFRLYAVYFLEQFGPEWQFFAREDGPREDPDPLDALMEEAESDPSGLN